MQSKRKLITLLTTGALIGSFALAPIQAAPFLDIRGDAIDFVSNRGIMVGTSYNKFSPEQKLTRAQFVAILYRYSGQKVAAQPSFSDVPKDAYYADAVTWGVNNHIIAGTSKTTFSPNLPLTQEQVIAMLDRYHSKYAIDAKLDIKPLTLQNVAPWAKKSFEQLSSLFKDSTVNGQKVMTRENIAEILYKFDQEVKRTSHRGPANSTVIKRPTEKKEDTSNNRYTNEVYDEKWDKEIQKAYTLTDEQKAFLKLLNDARENVGAPELIVLDALNKAATIRVDEAYDLCAKDKNAKPWVRPEDPEIKNIYEAVGLFDFEIEDGGEAAVVKFDKTFTAQEAFDELMASPSERKALLHPDYRYIGLANKASDKLNVWVQVLIEEPDLDDLKY